LSTPSDPLQEHLLERRSEGEEALKDALVSALWGTVSVGKLQDSEAFLEYYFDQCSLIDTQDLTINIHQDIVNIVSFVRDHGTLSRNVLIRKVQQDRPAWLGSTSDSAEKALEFAVRLWLMVETDGWTVTQSLKEFILHNFPSSSQAVNVPPFPLTFNAYNLERIGGFKIVWTSCIQDHLSLDQTYTEISVFHQASFLRNYQNTAER